MKDDFNAYLGQVFQRVAWEHTASRIKEGELVEADILGGWWHGGEEIDLIAYSSKVDEGVLLEVKWKALSYREAKSIIFRLVEKARRVPIGRERYGIVAREVAERGRLEQEGYVVVDLDELLATPSSKSKKG